MNKLSLLIKKQMNRLGLTCILFISTLLGTFAQNLLLNPGFENGISVDFTNWSKPNGPSSLLATTTSGEYRSGVRALKAVVTGTQGNAPEPWSVQMVADEVPTVVGSSYTFKIWVKAATAGTGEIRFSTNPYPDPTADYTNAFYDVTTGWTQLTWVFTAKKSTTKMVLDLGKNVNTYFLDDAELTGAATPPSSVVLNSGFELGTGNDFTNWGKYTGMSSLLATTTSGEFRSGNRGLKAVVGSSGNPWDVQLVSDNIPTVIGISYTFKAWVKAMTTGNQLIRFSTKPDAVQTDVKYSDDFNVTTGWTQVSFTFIAYATQTQIALDLGKSANTYYIDDISWITPTTPQATLIPNPSFELGTGDNFTDWTKPNNPGNNSLLATTVASEVRTGARALKAITTGGAEYLVQMLSIPVNVIQGNKYTFKIWVKGTTAGTKVRFSTQSSAGAIYSDSDPLNNYIVSTGWTQFSFVFTADAAQMKIALDLNKNANTYFLDDMELTENHIASLLSNGGFETGGPGNNFTNWGKWNDTGNNTLQETTTVGEFRSGLRGVKAVVATAGNPWSVQLVSDPVYTLPGARYTFKLYAKAATAGSTIRFSTQPNAVYSDSDYNLTYNVTTTGFTEFVWTFKANTTNTRMVLDLGKFANTFYLDDANMVADCSSPSFAPPSTQTPIATGKNKFLGCIYSTAQIPNADKYFNQVAPENSGKWGDVEGTQGVYDFTAADAAREYAKVNNFPFRYHVLLWGSQQPLWLKPMTDVQKVAKIKAWMQAVANHYDGSTNARAKLEYIEVLNEALNDPPNNTTNPHPTYGFPGADNTNDGGSGDYVNALKSLNTELETTPGTYDWIVNSFKLARQYFGCETKLMINEYAIENTPLAMADYTTIIQLLKNDNLVDVVGMQTHTFGTQVYGAGLPAAYTANTANLTANLNTLAAKGYPIMVTEFDVDGDVSLDALGNRITSGTQEQKDAFQASEYQRIFNVYWNHPSVIGITLWGYRTGHWRSGNAAYIMDPCSGAERPAMTFLNTTIRASTPPALSTTFNVTGVMKSKQTGDWSDPATWSCGRLPSVTEDVTIISGHIVNIINANAKAKKVINNGQLNFLNSTAKLGLME
jgi:endo-1,4-beta-xylanase